MFNTKLVLARTKNIKGLKGGLGFLNQNTVIYGEDLLTLFYSTAL